MKKQKDKTVIPHGVYCERCPHLSIKKELPDQENGYCAYLGKSDYDLNRDPKHKYKLQRNRYDGDKKMEIGESKTAAEWGMNFSLLWDGVKMCGIRYNDDCRVKGCKGYVYYREKDSNAYYECSECKAIYVTNKNGNMRRKK